MNRPESRIDPDSPVPLYHQIAQLIRARIQGGELAPGDTLEPLREAATEWEVNFHTVRHAYAELARDGLVEMRGPRGTHVLGVGPKTGARNPGARTAGDRKPGPARQDRPARPARSNDVESFLAEVVHRARNDFGFSAQELAVHLTKNSTGAPRPRVYVLECSEHQCQDLSRQIESSWDVEAVPWCLDREGDLPKKDLVATHFHYNEIRLRWPERLAETFFVPISPARSLRSEIERRLGRLRDTKDFTLTLCERDEPTAEAVAADLSVLLPANEFPLRTRIIESSAATPAKNSNDPFETIDGDLLLLPPRIWGSLPAGQRNNNRLVEVRYLYDPRELEETARKLGWEAAA